MPRRERLQMPPDIRGPSSADENLRGEPGGRYEAGGNDLRLHNALQVAEAPNPLVFNRGNNIDSEFTWLMGVCTEQGT